MTWLDIVEDSRAIEAVYSMPPSLVGVQLFEVRLERYGLDASVRFDLSTYPTEPPQKWLQSGFNRVQVTLQLSSVIDVEIRGWGLDDIGNIELTKQEDVARLIFTTSTTHIDITTKWVYVQKMSAYLCMP